MKDKLIDTTVKLRNAIEGLSGLKLSVANLSRALDVKRNEFIQIANEIKSDDGKKLYSNAELREGYVQKRMAELDGPKEMYRLQDEIIKLESEIRALDYEYYTYKTLVEAQK